MTSDLTFPLACYGGIRLFISFAVWADRTIERWQLRRIERGRREPVRTLSLVDAWRRERQTNNTSRRWS